MSRADADPPRPADSPSHPDASMVPGEVALSAEGHPRLEVAAAQVKDVAVAAAAADVPDDAVPSGCPFLVAESGGWRLRVPSRDHRCSAVSPPAPLSPDKQTRLCLTPAYASCATYIASVAARTERLGAAPVIRATRWGLARTTSVIEDRGGLRSRVSAGVLDRRRWPAIPAVLLVLTLFALALSGFRTGTPATAGASATPARPAAAATLTPPPVRSGGPSTPAVTSEPSAAPTKSPTATAAGTPKPSASFRTYRVRAGDTLGAIANRFDTTVRAIAELNGITDPGRLQVGQVLLIP